MVSHPQIQPAMDCVVSTIVPFGEDNLCINGSAQFKPVLCVCGLYVCVCGLYLCVCLCVCVYIYISFFSLFLYLQIWRSNPYFSWYLSGAM